LAKRILVVDDNIDAAVTLRIILECAGHDVLAVFTPQSALEALSPPPDIAVLDIGLPGMDGYELAREIRARLGMAPFLIALTGWGSTEDVQRAWAAGFDRHFKKPADPAELILAIERGFLSEPKVSS
jgi:DNA-binding response OmpR family regulator